MDIQSIISLFNWWLKDTMKTEEVNRSVMKFLGKGKEKKFNGRAIKRGGGDN